MTTKNEQQQQQKQTLQQPPIRVALLGTGIFATNCHIPTIKKFPELFECVAVWSRRKESIQTLLDNTMFGSSANSNHDENNDLTVKKDDSSLPPQGYSGEDGLQQILQRKDIHAIIMALPLDVQPQYVTMALNAGKHVLSEKPIAPTLLEAQRLCDFYYNKEFNSNKIQWSVAENFRYEPGIQRVADAVKNEIGTPTLLSLDIRLPFKPDNQYLQTTWRNQPSWYGGLFPDVFVHSTAMVRKVLGGSEPTQLSAITSSHAEHIPSVDTMAANVIWGTRGVTGTISLSFVCTFVKFELEVTGTKGHVMLQRKTFKDDGPPGYYVTVNGESKEEFSFAGIEKEFEAFGKACRQKEENNHDKKEEDFVVDCNTPLEALKDLTFVEACLESGKEGGKIVTLYNNGYTF